MKTSPQHAGAQIADALNFQWSAFQQQSYLAYRNNRSLKQNKNSLASFRILGSLISVSYGELAQMVERSLSM